MSWESTWYWIGSNSGYASWGQFVGAILALGIAIAIPWNQERLRRKEARKKVSVLKLAIVRIARDSEDAIRKLSDMVSQIHGKSNAFPDAQFRVVESHLTTLNSIDLTQFPSEEMLVPFFYLKAQLAEGLSHARTIKEFPAPIGGGQETLVGMENLVSLLSLDAASREVSTASREIAHASEGP